MIEFESEFLGTSEYNKEVIRILFLGILFLFSNAAIANELDLDLAESLKIEANHNLDRLKSYSNELKNNRIFDEERERGLSEYLEEQERWDLIRERGLRDYRSQKKQITPQEGSFEHNQYLEELESQTARYEKSREIHVSTKKRFTSQSTQNTVDRLEVEELGLVGRRPRYELSLRSRNKWVNSGGKSTGISSGSSSGFQPTPQPPVDFSPTPEFPPAPAPYEGVEEAQAPLPPPVFDSNNGGMTDFGSPSPDMSIPPPPPPPPDFDF